MRFNSIAMCSWRLNAVLLYEVSTVSCRCYHRPAAPHAEKLAASNGSWPTFAWRGRPQVASLKTLAQGLEQRLSAAEGREAGLLAECREAEAVAAERDQLAAQVRVSSTLCCFAPCSLQFSAALQGLIARQAAHRSFLLDRTVAWRPACRSYSHTTLTRQHAGCGKRSLPCLLLFCRRFLLCATIWRGAGRIAGRWNTTSRQAGGHLNASQEYTR